MKKQENINKTEFMYKSKGVRGRKIAGKISFTAALVTAVISGALLCRADQKAYQSGLSEKILRFHIMANSDDEEDQELKLKVRDAVGRYLSDSLAEASDLEESEEIIEDRLTDIETVAEHEIRKEGYTYPVKARLTEAEFPVKTYGNYTFPAGTYEALEVEIGAGAGHNWWCVMYPNMCFADSIYAEPTEETEEELKAVLTKEEYEKLLEEGDYEVRFRFLTFLNKQVPSDNYKALAYSRKIP